MADERLAAHLQRTLLAAGVAVVSVTVGDSGNRATWKVQPVSLQATAQPTIDAFDPAAVSLTDADLAASSTATSRQKDMLATCALVVRARGIAAWNALTIAQKTAATLAEADVWENIREFVEKNT